MACDGNQMTKRDASRLENKTKEYIFFIFYACTLLKSNVSATKAKVMLISRRYL